MRFADGSDLLMLEATLPAPEPDGARGHLTPPRRASTAPRAGARRLVITHMSDELDESCARGDAERAFGGPVLVAHEGAVYEV